MTELGETPEPLKRIGVQICTRDRPDYLAVLLTSLLRQTQKNWDLFLVDNSVKPIQEHPLIQVIINRILNEGHRVKYIRADPEIRDIGQLRNMALDADDCVWGCRCDDDSWLEPDYLELLYKFIQLKDLQGSYKELIPGGKTIKVEGHGVGAVGGLVPFMWMEKTFMPPREKINVINEFYDLEGESDQCYFYNGVDYMEADHLRSSFMYWNEVAKKIRHPEVYGKTGYREETDFSYRIKLAGYKLFVVPDAICWHLVSPYGGGRDENTDIRAGNIYTFKKRMDEFKKEGV
jgi:glycosyltransferase involved in cell wall biosynthesis